MAAEPEAQGGGDPPKKSKLGLILGIVVGVLFLVGGTVVGILLGPRLLGGAAANAEAAPEVPAAEESEPVTIVSSQFAPLIIDLRNQKGAVHHLKVGMAAELTEQVTEDQFRLVMPRGRAAAIQYLRTLSYEEVSDPQKYASIQEELTKRVQEAVGTSRARRILLVDFVTQ